MDAATLARKLELAEAKFETRDRQRRAAIAAMRRHLARSLYLENRIKDVLATPWTDPRDILTALTRALDVLPSIGIREMKAKRRSTPEWR
jgi:hypothetical protein